MGIIEVTVGAAGAWRIDRALGLDFQTCRPCEYRGGDVLPFLRDEMVPAASFRIVLAQYERPPSGRRFQRGCRPSPQLPCPSECPGF